MGRNDVRHARPHEPLLIRRNDVPWRRLRARSTQHVLVCPLVFIPMRAFLYVRSRELPILLRVVQTRQKTLSLLFTRNVQEKLQNSRVLFGKRPFEVIDVVVSRLPNMFEPLLPKFTREQLAIEKVWMNAHDQHFLVVGTIENCNLSGWGQDPHWPPEKMV